ncbi:hypothetical protein FPQ18DRAFT_256401 [Pyronema domesticum]|nr:hypothetical protein FPQ18DRAFT_256401 [Pyronema domesticum]
MQGRRSDVQPQPIAAGQRPPFRHSPHSMSLPSTPHHLPRINGVSRSPSPPAHILDSPRSAASEPASTISYPKAPVSGCPHETLLCSSRRRMPYSLGIDKLKPEKPKLDKLPKAQEEALTKDMEDEFEKLKPSSESEIRRKSFLEKLSRILNDEWPGYDTQVHAFGSTENHLCMDDSDVDVCITTKCKEIEQTCKLSALLAKRGMEKVVCVPGAKVPIVKIWDPEFNVACDMNVNSTLALDNTRMIKTYVEIDDRVRPLALIIKHWTKQRILNNAAIGGTLSSYTWICMILNFLQTREPPVLPSLHVLPHKKKPPNCGVDVSFADEIDVIRGAWVVKNHETLGELLFGFFKKYGHDLDYETSVLSVREGRILSKDQKGWTYLQNNRLCVEEPFNTSRNLGNTADDCSMRGIHLEFRRAHKILAEKANLSEVCEQWDWPPEEIHPQPPPQAPSRPVTLSRSNSNHGRNRQNYSGSQRGRGGYHNQYNNRNAQRRGSSGAAAFNQNLMQSPYYGYTPEMYAAYMTPSEQQYMALQQMQFQAQMAQVAQQHAQSQLHPHHNRSNSNSIAANGSSASHDAYNNPAFTAAYIAHMVQYSNLLYPSFGLGHGTHSDTSNPTSPPHTPGMDSRAMRGNDGMRLGLDRNARTYSNGSRSQSQPPSFYSTNGYGRSIPSALATSEDEDFGDHSSNGNPPETPPEEESDEYVGYYSIGGTLIQQDVAVMDPHDDVREEPFMEQKTTVDRQKRYSSEKLPAPMLGQSMGNSPISSKARPNDRHVQSAYPGDAIFPFEHCMTNGVDHSAEPAMNGFTPEHLQPFTHNPRKLVEVHNRQQMRSDDGSSQASVVHNFSALSVTSSPATTTMSIGSSSECESDSMGSPSLSPNGRQRGGSHQSSWTNGRGRNHNSHEEIVISTLTPVPEAPTPVPTPSRKAPEPKPAPETPTKREKQTNGHSNGHSAKKSPSKDDPVPPTPAPAGEKNGQKNGHGKPKTNGSKSNASHHPKKKDTSDSKADQKSDTKGTWKKPQPKKKNKRPAAKEATVAKESERKGG